MRWLAWLLWSLASAAICWNAAYRISTRSGSFGEPWHVAFLTDLSLLMLSAVGLVVAVRRPQNAFGWVVLVAVLGFAVQEAATIYAGVALRNPGTLPAGQLVALLPAPGLAIGGTALAFMSCCSLTAACPRLAGGCWPGPPSSAVG
jgi:hypothetical protein